MKNLFSLFILVALFVGNGFTLQAQGDGLNLKAWHWVPGENPKWPDFERFIQNDVAAGYHQDYMENKPPSIVINSADSFPDGLTGIPKSDYNVNGTYGYQRILFRFTGYLVADETGEYEFRVASKSGSQFFLSTDESTGNLQLIAGVWGDSAKWVNATDEYPDPNHYNNYHPFTGSAEFTKYPDQQSGKATLTASNFYAVKFEYKSFFGDDNHFTVQWKSPTGSWTTIPNENLWTEIGTPTIKIDAPIVQASVTENDVTLSWDPIDNATGYKVLQNGVIIGSTSKTDTTIMDLDPDVYNFAVVATTTIEGYRDSDNSALVPVQIDQTSIQNTSSINLRIYPNPASSELHVKGVEEINSYSIHTLDGKSINLSSNHPGGVIDISELERGIYILSVTTNKGKANQRFVKQ